MQSNKEVRKPNDGQFGWLYKAFCQEKNLKPLNAIQAYLQTNCVRFCTDRVPLKHWSPILCSIAENRNLSKIYIYSRRRCRKICEKVNTEEKLEKLWRCKGITQVQPILYTNFLLRCFVDSVAVCTRDSLAITSLTLDGFPLRPKYLSILCSGLTNNTVLAKLSLIRCRIGDNGCDLLLGCLKNNPKLCTLNLSSCRLTNRSARYLSSFLKRRKADLLQNVWEESTESSHEENTYKTSQGLHTLALNQNPKLGDNGLRQLSFALTSDVSVRSLSLRQCGITKHGAEIMIRVLHKNNVITKLDLTENHISINTLQNMLKILKRRQEIAGNGTLKKRFRLGWRRNMFKNVRGPVNRGGKRFLNKNENRNTYSSKNCQWERIRKFEKRGKKINELQQGKEDIYRTKKLSDLESELINLIQSNFKLKEELLSNKALLNEQTEQRSRMEYELQKMSLRLDELKSKVVGLNCLSSKAYSESQLMQGFKYVFDKLESFSTMKQNSIEKGVILNNAEPLWSSPVSQQRGNSFMNCIQSTPHCLPFKI